MNAELLERLRPLTEEERAYHDGRKEINRELYMSADTQKINAVRLMDTGKLISIRKHTRFVYFPRHTHDYVEVVYMCSGKTKHIINGAEVELNEGELLFLNQNSIQEVLPAGENDIAINFIILPAFFDYALNLMDENQLKDFLIDCMSGKESTVNYLHFRVADALPVQNLVENLIWTLINPQPYKQLLNKATMGILLMQLTNYINVMDTNAQSESQRLIMMVLSFIEENYRDGQLSDLANILHCDLSWLSREIKHKTGQNFTDLVQNKRLSQALYYLTNTKMIISDIALAVGYENISYFHRLFKKKYDISPRQARLGETCK
jgi:AraC family transcriptional regulator, L-rhamnose operon regulatory protein RhaS